MTAPALDRLRELPGFKPAGKNQWAACCPAHKDDKASLAISMGSDDRILLHCFAGCELDRILQAAGIGKKDLFANGNGHHEPAGERPTTDWKGRAIACWHPYVDETGHPLYWKARVNYQDAEGQSCKEFLFWANGSWGVTKKNIRRVPFHLDRLVKADEILILEGESDVEAAEELGFTATTLDNGANADPQIFVKYLKPYQRVVVMGDADAPGLAYQHKVFNALYGLCRSLKSVALPGMPDGEKDLRGWLAPRRQDLTGAGEQLSIAIEGAPEWKPSEPEPQEQPATAGWKLYDAGAVAEWPQDPLAWLVDGLIPRGSIGFMSAPPKDRKSLLTEDLALHLAQPDPRLWLGKFKVTPTRVLYIAREDPLRRVRERMTEICSSYGMPLPELGRLQFLVRERIHLTDLDHRAWLKDTIRVGGFELLILDVINRMHPDLDEISAKDMGRLVAILEELNRDLGVTILADDHTRKPQGRNTARDSQEPNPFDMKGSIAKYGCADFMICLSRTPQQNRMQVYCENKDTDERPHFFLDVSPKGSSEPKFQYAGSIERAAGDMRQMGDNNRGKVLEAYGREWRNRKDVAAELGMSASTVAKHTADLLKAGKLEQRGSGRSTQYRQSSEADENTPRTNSDKGLFDND